MLDQMEAMAQEVFKTVAAQVQTKPSPLPDAQKPDQGPTYWGFSRVPDPQC